MLYDRSTLYTTKQTCVFVASATGPLVNIILFTALGGYHAAWRMYCTWTKSFVCTQIQAVETLQQTYPQGETTHDRGMPALVIACPCSPHPWLPALNITWWFAGNDWSQSTVKIVMQAGLIIAACGIISTYSFSDARTV